MSGNRGEGKGGTADNKNSMLPRPSAAITIYIYNILRQSKKVVISRYMYGLENKFRAVYIIFQLAVTLIEKTNHFDVLL